jgi:hypothetical protein
MALAVATGARGNSTALVGTPETVAEALVAYYDLGATSLLIRGYDPLADAVEYGRELIPPCSSSGGGARRGPRGWWHAAIGRRDIRKGATMTRLGLVLASTYDK